jgi:hypothetical protein
MTNDTRPPVAPVEAEWDKLDQLMLAYEEAGEGNSVDSVIHAYSAMFSKKQVLRARMIEWEQRLARLEALIPLADAACDYADQHCRWFDISTAPHGTTVLTYNADFLPGVVSASPIVAQRRIHQLLGGKHEVIWVGFANGVTNIRTPTHWRPLPPPPTNPPLPTVFTDLGAKLESLKQ